MAETAQPPAPAEAPMLPLFYKSPQPLHAQLHAGWRLKTGDAAFAAATPFVPIVASEIAAAARSYPIVFAGGNGQPLAVLALAQGSNLFVEDGRWLPDQYIPAYVRRYPFTFIATRDPDGFQLSIDAGSDRVAQGGSDGTALFEDGKPSALTAQALEFCTAFGREAELTSLFSTALREKDLLVDRRADATLPDGRKLGLNGFQIVDPEKFAALDDETVLAWHKQGLLALVHHHLASLDRFRALLDRQALRAVTGPSHGGASTDTADAAPAAEPNPHPDLADGDTPAPRKTKKA